MDKEASATDVAQELKNKNLEEASNSFDKDTDNPPDNDTIRNALSDKDLAVMSKALRKKDAKISDLERRLSYLERRLKSNERFARTFATCIDTQVVAIDAVTSVVRRALKTDAEIASDLSSAIHEYDRHKVRRWLSGFLRVFLWVGSVAAAAFVGAFIYWIFSAN